MKLKATMPETTMLTELGARAQAHRVGMNLSQAQLAKKAGVAQRTVERLEAGSSVQLETLLRILRALGLADNLDQLIPESSIRPTQLLGSKADIRLRSSKRRKSNPKGAMWTWGDET